MSLRLDDVPATVPAVLLEAFVDGIRKGHDIAARAHIPEEGWDSYTWGQARYRLSWNWVVVHAQTLPDVVVETLTQSLRIKHGEYAFGFYNGGTSTDWDVHSFDFAATPRREQPGVSNQLSFEGIGGESPPPDLQNLLVVYSGRPALGCEVIHIGAPLFNAKTGRSSWAWVTPIWRLADAERPMDQTGPERFVSFREAETSDPPIQLLGAPSDAEDGRSAET